MSQFLDMTILLIRFDCLRFKDKKLVQLSNLLQEANMHSEPLHSSECFA